ncbi:hypothetical protein HPB47_016666 [Ixodes persulcatus]|uniref:Uncharacterized protein n=1 Tax=Ixodes persulcatus TaxID=34615 RepID=A0AC60QQA3_IXOPE|nr:hypothetical protein HPB47_016666 [Ixodes persulcatus]
MEESEQYLSRVMAAEAASIQAVDHHGAPRNRRGEGGRPTGGRADPDPPTTVSPFLERSFGVATVVVSLINVGLRLSQSLGLLWLFLTQAVPSLAVPLSPWLFNGMSLVAARGAEGPRTFASSPSLTDLPFALLGIGEDGCRRRFMCELAVWLTNRHPLLVSFFRHLR